MYSSDVDQRTTRSTRHGVGLPARAPLIFFLLSTGNLTRASRCTYACVLCMRVCVCVSAQSFA